MQQASYTDIMNYLLIHIHPKRRQDSERTQTDGMFVNISTSFLNIKYFFYNFFFIQNIGLWGIPTLIGKVLDVYCIVGKKADGTNLYDYTIPMCIFTGIACLSLVVAFMLKRADKKYGYQLEEPNIQG